MQQVKNIAAEDAAKLLEHFKSNDAGITAYAPTNTLIITDTGSNLQRMLSIWSMWTSRAVVNRPGGIPEQKSTLAYGGVRYSGPASNFSTNLATVVLSARELETSFVGGAAAMSGRVSA